MAYAATRMHPGIRLVFPGHVCQVVPAENLGKSLHSSEIANMNILTINLSLAGELKKMGHNLLEGNPPPGAILDVEALCGRTGFTPDCVVQQETLGKRVLLSNTISFSCPKVFWSIDTHLNTYWQRYYGQNFDLFLTTQKSWTGKLHRMGVKNAAWLPWYGVKRGWVPWGKRARDISFVGRITEVRLMRKWMSDFLREHFRVHIAQDIPFAAMLDTYANTRLAPNEAIFGEVNFRTFEAASCGAMVISQDLKEDLSALFDPGREIITYENVLELKNILEFYLKSPRQAKMIAAAGQARVQRSHLPRHRASELDSLIRDLTREKSGNHNIWTWLSSLWLEENSPKKTPSRKIPSPGSLPVTAETLFFRIQEAVRKDKKVLELLIPIIQKRQFDFHLLFNTGCSFAAMHAGNLQLAKGFFLRYCQSCSRPVPQISNQSGLVRAWTREMVSAGEKIRPGFLYDPGQHLPQSALECLVWMQDNDPERSSLLPDIKSLLGNVTGSEPIVLQALSQLSLHRQKDWKYNLELARINLKAFRLRQGLEELILARENAAKAGEEKHFHSRLKRLDKKGLLRTALDEVNYA
jgi:hypothetical protein